MFTQEKDKRVKMVLSYLLQQNISVELHMIEMLKQFPLQLSEGDAANIFDVLKLDIINGGPASAIT